MDVSPLVARFEAEAIEKSAGSGDPIWDAIFYGIEQLKESGGDYDQAQSAYSMIMRVLIDSGPVSEMPALEALGKAMNRWRMDRNVEARKRKT
jgi:hypothetical protein